MLSLGTLLRLMCSSVLELSYYKVSILNPTEVRAFFLMFSTHSTRVIPAVETGRVPERICGVPFCAWHLPSSKERDWHGREYCLRASLWRIGADNLAPLGTSGLGVRWGGLFSGSDKPFIPTSSLLPPPMNRSGPRSSSRCPGRGSSRPM